MSYEKGQLIKHKLMGDAIILRAARGNSFYELDFDWKIRLKNNGRTLMVTKDEIEPVKVVKPMTISTTQGLITHPDLASGMKDIRKMKKYSQRAIAKEKSLLGQLESFNDSAIKQGLSLEEKFNKLKEKYNGTQINTD